MGIKKSFTFIEILIVLGITGIIIPVIFGIFFTIINFQLKIYRLSKIKNEGDYILNQLKYLIKDNAVSIHNDEPPNDNNQVCLINNYPENPGSKNSSLYFLDKTNNYFRIYLENNRVSSYSSSIGLTYLNSNQAYIENFSIRCQVGSSYYSSPLVFIQFTICYRNNLTNQCLSERYEELNSLNYQSAIKLKPK